MKLLKGFDFYIPIIFLLIEILSLVSIGSVAPNLFIPQLTFFVIGLFLFFLFSQIEFPIYQKLGGIFFIGIIFLLVLNFIIGTISRGSIRWIQLGFFTVQPSEIIKPFLITFFAFFFAGHENKIRRLFFGFFLFLIPMLLVFIQPDLGSTMVISAGFFGILLTFIPLIYLLIGGMGLGLSFPALWFLLADYQKQRIFSFLNPYSDPLGTGYNLIQAMISVGSGQIFGRGIGRGTQSHLNFLPEQHTDFIFASFAEEIGFIGSSLLLILYILLLWRLLKIGHNAKQSPSQYFCLGVFFMLLFQIFINVGMNLGIAPIAGITLPLFSYGGSSLVATMICLGIVESIARHQKKQEIFEIK